MGGGEGKRRCAARRGPLSTRRRSREEAHRLLQTFPSERKRVTYAHVTGVRERERESGLRLMRDALLEIRLSPP